LIHAATIDRRTAIRRTESVRRGRLFWTWPDVCRRRKYSVVGSPALMFEIGRIKDTVKLNRVQRFYHQVVTEVVHYSRGIAKRARYLSSNSDLSEPDSLHLAFAEAARVDVLLTTDDDFETIASGLSTAVKVINPVKFLKEVMP